MDIITQNTYEVLELVEAGQISAEEVDYLISEGTINPYLFESVLDELIAENSYLLSESDFEDKAKLVKNINIMLKNSHNMSPEKVQSLKARLANLTNGDEHLAKINSLGSQTLWGKSSADVSNFLKKSREHELNGTFAHSGDSTKSEPETSTEHSKGFVDHVIDAYHKGLNHAKQAYESAKEVVREHPGAAGAAAGAAAAGAAGYAAYKYLKNKKAKAGK